MTIPEKITRENAVSYKWGADCDSFILSDSSELSVKQERMPAGASEQLHYHNEATQFFFMLKGVATFYVEDQKINIRQHEGLTIRKGQKHFVVNESGYLIEFLVVSQPCTANDRINL